MAQKVDYINSVLNSATTMAGEVDTVKNQYDVYFDRGYNGGGADPITQQDLTDMGLGISLANFTAPCLSGNPLTRASYTDQGK